jgi:LCP family protein required for cell wall assembly
MRTTLKRGIGRGAGANGNGRAILPPDVAPFTRYRQPPRRGRGASVAVATGGAFVGLLFGTAIAAAVTKAVETHGVHRSPLLEASAAGVAAVLLVTVIAALLARRVSSRWQPFAVAMGWLCAAGLLVNAGYGGGAYLYYNQTVAAVAAHSHDVRVAQKHLAIPPANHATIALVLGYDKRIGGPEASLTGHSSDTMMLLRADPVTETVSMLSFPRDLRTEIHCPRVPLYVDRINAAYGRCGSTGSLETVKALTNLPINYLITVNFIGFRQIVDKVGGVWIDVDRRYYNKNVGTEATNFSDIDLHPGYQKLNGQDALAFVRYRHTDSDLYRIARQQEFVKGLKQQISKNLSVWKLLRIVGAIQRNVEIGRPEGSGSLGKAIESYALFAYQLPAGHVFQTKIEDLQNYDLSGAELIASQQAIDQAVQSFTHPDIEAPEKAADVALGIKRKRAAAPSPAHTTVTVLNGNGIVGAASNAAYALAQRGYRILIPPTGKLRNAPTWDYFHTKVYYDESRAGAKAAAAKLSTLFGDAEIAPLPVNLVQLADRAMVTAVVGKTFHGQLVTASVDQTPKKQPPYVRSDPGQTESLLKSVRNRLDFPLQVPTVIERASSVSSQEPIRVYALKKGFRAVRLTFLTGSDLAGYWGIEETRWPDAPVLQQPSSKHIIGGREYDFYFDGPHLHMVVLRTHGTSYWVVNTLLNAMSNDTMVAIAKGLRPLR